MIFLRLVFTAALLAAVLATVSPESLAKALTSVRVGPLLLAVLAFTVAQFVSALRYCYIAGTMAAPVSFKRSAKAHFIGLWFNQILPTGLGGDVAKVAILRQDIGLATATRAAIHDRVSGLLILMASVLVLLPAYQYVYHTPVLTAVLGLVAAGFSAGMVLAARYGGLVAGKWIPSFVTDLLCDMRRLYATSPFGKLFWASLVIHVLAILAFWLIGLSLGAGPALVDCVLLVPLVFLVALMPLSIAGWGAREASAIGLFSLAGIEPEVAMTMSILFGLMLLVIGAPGLLLVLTGAKGGISTK